MRMAWLKRRRRRVRKSRMGVRELETRWMLTNIQTWPTAHTYIYALAIYNVAKVKRFTNQNKCRDTQTHTYIHIHEHIREYPHIYTFVQMRHSGAAMHWHQLPTNMEHTTSKMALLTHTNIHVYSYGGMVGWHACKGHTISNENKSGYANPLWRM